MANKRVHYYKIKLKRFLNNADYTYELKKVLQNIFSNYCTIINNGVAKTLTLRYMNEDVSLDILQDEQNWCFGRVGKDKDPSYVIIRDNNTKDFEYVLNNKSLLKKSLESCTYFLLNYQTGIISFIIGKDAPHVNVLTNIVNQYDKNYTMFIENIINPESVNKLFTPGAMLSKVKFTFKTPNIEILKEAGLNREQITALSNMDVGEIDIIVKNRPHRYLTKNHKIISGLVNKMEKLPEKVKSGVKFTGRTSKTNSQDFSFNEENLIYNVEIVNEKKGDGVRRKLTPDEMAIEIRKKLYTLYEDNIGDLIYLANIE